MAQRKTTFPPVRTQFIWTLSLERLQESTTIPVLPKTLREQSPGPAATSVQEEQKRRHTHPEERMVQSAHASLALSAVLKEKKEKEVGAQNRLQRLLPS